MADSHKNFAYSVVAVAPTPPSSGLTLGLSSGGGSRFPAVPFNATVWASGQQALFNNAEIVRVTGLAGDSITSMLRAQEGSSARAITVGDQIAATITALTLQNAERIVGEIRLMRGKVIPSGWLKMDGSSVLRTTYPDLFNAQVQSMGTVTVTVASPGVFTLNAHGLVQGDAVFLETTGALPTGLAADTTYYVIASGLTANTFQLSAARPTPNGIGVSVVVLPVLQDGSAITTTGTQSGVHTLFFAPDGVADATHFNLPDGRGRVWVGQGTQVVVASLAINDNVALASRYGGAQPWAVGGSATAPGGQNSAAGELFAPTFAGYGVGTWIIAT